LILFNRHRQPDIQYILNSGFSGKGENVEIGDNSYNGDEDNYNELLEALTLLLGNLKFFICEAKDMRTS
jgi:hypothetical protein